MGEALLENCKKTLRSCLLTEKHGIKVAYIEKDYYNISGEKMPYRELGYRNAVDFVLQKMSDTARLSVNPEGDRVFMAVADETTQHIASMVKSQKSKKKRTRGGFGFSNNRYSSANTRGKWSRGQSVPRGGRNLSGSSDYGSFNGQRYSQNQSRSSSSSGGTMVNVASHRRPPSSSSRYSNPSGGDRYQQSNPSGGDRYQQSNSSDGDRYQRQDSSGSRGRPITGNGSTSSDAFVSSSSGLSSGRSRAMQDWSQSGSDTVRAQGDHQSNESTRRVMLTHLTESGWAQQGGDSSSYRRDVPSADQATKNLQSCDSSVCSESGRDLSKEDLRWKLRERHAMMKSGQLNQESAPATAPLSREVNITAKDVPARQANFSAKQVNASAKEAYVPPPTAPPSREVNITAKDVPARQADFSAREVNTSANEAYVRPRREVPPRFRQTQESNISTVVSEHLNRLRVTDSTGAGADSQQSIICDRAMAILKPKPSGIWAHHLGAFYKDKYLEDAPSNLLDILTASGVVDIEQIGEHKLVLPRDVSTQPSPISSGQTSAKTSGPTHSYSKPGHGTPAVTTKPSTVVSKSLRPPNRTEPYDAIISFINFTNDIAIRLVGAEYSEKLAKLENTLANMKGVPCRNVTAGTLCVNVRKDFETNALTACRILIHQRDDGFQYGEFVDYGDFSDGIDPSELFELPSTLNTLPYQAIRCQLTGLELFADDEGVIDLLDKHALGVNCKAKFDQWEPCISVTLWTENGVLNEDLSNALLTPQLRQIGEVTPAIVSYISQTGSVFLNLPGRGFERMSALSESLQHIMLRATSADKLEIGSEPGTFCLALASSSGAWSRAEILAHLPSTHQVIVQYIDYGDEEYVLEDSLYKLSIADEEFRKLPSQAIQCQLKDLPPCDAEWTDDGLNLLAHLVPSDRLVNVLMVSSGSTGSCCSGDANDDTGEDVPVIDISCTEDLPSVCDYLRQRNDIWRRKKGSDVVSELAAEVSARVVVSESAAPRASSLLTVTRPVTNDVIYITWATDPHNFRAIPHQYCEQLQNLTKELQVHMSSDDNNNGRALLADEVGTKQLYAGLHDNMWYRVRVVSALPIQAGAGSYRVQFVDYGDAAVMLLANIHQLPEKFHSLPMLAINMQLAVSIPSGEEEWSDEMARLFCEVALEKTFRVEVISETADKVSVLLYDCSTDEPVLKSLLV